jgi:hypothetical protein
MRPVLFACVVAALAAGSAQAGEWRAQPVDTPARVSAIKTINGEPLVNSGGLWYRLTHAGAAVKLAFVDTVTPPAKPVNALPDGHVVTGSRNIARAWLAEPTTRYGHGILGDKIEAGSLVIESRDGKIHTLRLKRDAVFEDLEPRLVDLDGDGHDEVVVVKSYLKRGSALAVVALHRGRYKIAAETPPLGGPNRWLNPAGIADFTGDGKTDIALVRQPHVVGELELWRYADGDLTKAAMLPGAANHIIGSRAQHLSAIADFDGDGIMDIALPSLDRAHLRIVSFAPRAREIASVALPAKAVTNLALISDGAKSPAIAVGLADGTLVVLRND